MREVFKELWYGIPERARYSIIFALGFVFCGMIQLARFLSS